MSEVVKLEMGIFTDLELVFKKYGYDVNKIDFSKDMGCMHLTVNKPKN